MKKILDSLNVKDFIFGVLVFVLSVVVYVISLKMPLSQYEPLGPSSLPKFLCIGLGILSCFIMKSSFKPQIKKEKELVKNKDTSLKERMLPLLIVSIVVIYTIILQNRLLNFPIATFALVMLLIFLLHSKEKKMGKRSFYFSTFLTSAFMSFGVYWIFTTLFNIRLR
jgi:Na+/H+ antiporter NhaD/arsenite permease-like protein